MINMTLVQIITTFLQLLLVVWFHFVLIIYNSLSPQPTPPSSALSLGLELIPLVSASTSSSCLCPQPQPSAPHLGLCYCINVLTLLNISASHHMILFFSAQLLLLVINWIHITYRSQFMIYLVIVTHFQLTSMYLSSRKLLTTRLPLSCLLLFILVTPTSLHVHFLMTSVYSNLLHFLYNYT